MDAKEGNYIPVTEPEVSEFYSRSGPYEVEFLFMELKSDKPPTDVILKVSYITGDRGIFKHVTVEFIKYRKRFQFENGYYIIYLNELDEFPEKIIPHKLTFINKRDVKSSATLFYRILFQV